MSRAGVFGIRCTFEIAEEWNPGEAKGVVAPLLIGTKLLAKQVCESALSGVTRRHLLVCCAGRFGIDASKARRRGGLLFGGSGQWSVIATCSR